MPTIDLRSDTVTQPTPSMRDAMARAEVGDDVFEEDPTVKKLEEMAAERTGKEAGLFVSSGTMANLVSLLTHCGRGEEIILWDKSHIFFYEQGGAAAVGGIHPRTIHTQPDGSLLLEEIVLSFRMDNIHFPRTRAVVLENTHNKCGGYPIPKEYFSAVGEVVRRNGLKLHVDGARIFNAAIALGTPVPELVESADSLSFCLSKGLAAPVGSLVCGSTEFIAQARRNRKLLGGGMRQAGVIAAAGIVALEEMVDRLADDHDNARKLAKGLAAIKGISIDPACIRTNIVYFDIKETGMLSVELAEKLEALGVRILATDFHQLRAVPTYHVSPADIDRALDVIGTVIETQSQ
jgi:threonine aldolase